MLCLVVRRLLTLGLTVGLVGAAGASEPIRSIYGDELATFDRATGEVDSQYLWEASLRDGQYPMVSWPDVAAVSADLTRANFRDAELFRADLFMAKADSAVFHSANFTEADLSVCSASSADFQRAQLDRVLLYKCDLSSALFFKASLTDADLRGAILAGTDFTLANLSGARFGPWPKQSARVIDVTRADFRGAVLVGTEGLDQTVGVAIYDANTEFGSNVDPSALGWESVPRMSWETEGSYVTSIRIQSDLDVSTASLGDAYVVPGRLLADESGRGVELAEGVEFRIAGVTDSETLTVTLELAGVSGEAITLWKDVGGALRAVASLSGSTSSVSYTITDNSWLDDDLTVGVIADPVFLAISSSATAVPTMPVLGILLLAALLLLVVRRRLA